MVNGFLCLWYTPEKFTWNPKMEVWKMMFLFNRVIFRFHVNIQGCKLEAKYTSPMGPRFQHVSSILEKSGS